MNNINEIKWCLRTACVKLISRNEDRDTTALMITGACGTGI